MIQLELFGLDGQPYKPLVKTIHTDLGVFGNRTDILVVDESTVRGTSLLECTDPAVQYHSNASRIEESETL